MRERSATDGPVSEVASEDDGGYRAAIEDVALIDRSSRVRLSLEGRAPEQVLGGLVSGKMPPPLQQLGQESWRGRAEGSALLTAKGRMTAVLRLLRAGPAPEDGFIMDLPASCREAALDHLRKFVPPRLATLRDESAESGMLTLLGPRAVERVADLLGAVTAATLRDLEDGDLVQANGVDGLVTVIRTAEVATPAYDLLAPAAKIRQWREALAGSTAELREDSWATLRIEAGVPEFGVDMDDTTIPVEAGIHGRVVDYTKGCFTGQEVLIRIRDRGHVNRLLRGLRLGSAEVPAPGTELFASAGERAVGRVTSAARSPRFGEVIALGYLRREVTTPGEVRVGGPTGSPARVEDLSTSWHPGAGSR